MSDDAVVAVPEMPPRGAKDRLKTGAYVISVGVKIEDTIESTQEMKDTTITSNTTLWHKNTTAEVPNIGHRRGA